MQKKGRWFPVVARVLLGLSFFVFGLNGFLHFLPQPPEPEKAGAFLGALFATGYMLPLIKGTETLAGLVILSGRAVPLALTILAPVVVNILAFHLFLAPGGLPLPIVLAALGIYVAWTYRAAFRGVLHIKSEPTDERAPSRAVASPAE
jgi:uncharacterized membrane protein YphA (DoxX/SURF4 family)